MLSSDRSRKAALGIFIFLFGGIAVWGLVVLYDVNKIQGADRTTSAGWNIHSMERHARHLMEALQTFESSPSEENRQRVAANVDLLWVMYDDTITSRLNLFFNRSDYYPQFQRDATELLDQLDSRLPNLTAEAVPSLLQLIEVFFESLHEMSLFSIRTYQIDREERVRIWREQLAAHGAALALFILFTGVLIWFLTRQIKRADTLLSEVEQSRRRITNYAVAASDWFWETDAMHRFVPSTLERRESGNNLIESWIGHRLEDRAEPPASDPGWAEYRRALSARQPIRDLRCRIDDGQGEHRTIRLTGVPVFDNEGVFLGYQGSATDETELNRLQSRLQTAQKMEALGQLAGGIAHDFNNLMSIMLGHIELLRDDEDDPKRREAHYEKILNAIRKGSAITNRLLSFTANRSHMATSFDANEALRTTADVAAPSMPWAISLSVDLPDDPLIIAGNRDEFELSILNLMNNARDAMPKGGTLTLLACKNASLPSDARLDISNSRLGYAHITVADTGTGMPAAILERCMDPLFTTKGVGSGTGLGLSLVYSLVKAMGGDMLIRSEEGVGTTVSLFIPLRADAVQDAPLSPAALAPRDLVPASVLVVEDDPDLRAYAVSALRQLGHEADGAAGIADACKSMADKGTYDILFSDVMLADGENGIDLASRLRSKHPDIGIVFTTGYAGVEIPSEKLTSMGAVMLSKPYTKQALENAIATCMSKKA